MLEVNYNVGCAETHMQHDYCSAVGIRGVYGGQLKGDGYLPESTLWNSSGE